MQNNRDRQRKADIGRTGKGTQSHTNWQELNMSRRAYKKCKKHWYSLLLLSKKEVLSIENSYEFTLNEPSF